MFRLESLTKQELIQLVRENASFDEDKQVQNVLLCRKRRLEQKIESTKSKVSSLKENMDNLAEHYRIFHQRNALRTMVMLSNQIEMQSKILETLTKRYEQLEGKFEIES